MNKKFNRSLIVGKFCPLHKGHEYLISTAIGNSEELIIFSYSEKSFSGMSATRRACWLRELFPSAHVFSFDKSDVPAIPDEAASDEEQRIFAAKYYRDKVNRPLNAIFTSEAYGSGFAQYMTEFLINEGLQNEPVAHVNVDQPRKMVPISASEIRKDIHFKRQFLSPTVYRDFVKDILFLGAESTGKSTLVELCVKEYSTVGVEEFGRTLYVEKNGNLNYEDMLIIGRRHRLDEEKLKGLANRFLFVDTGAMTTQLYSQFLFGKCDAELTLLATNKNYDLVFLCSPDFAMVQDGTRQDEEFRMRQHDWYLKELAARNIPYCLLEGSIQEKFKTIRKKLEVFDR